MDNVVHKINPFFWGVAVDDVIHIINPFPAQSSPSCVFTHFICYRRTPSSYNTWHLHHHFCTHITHDNNLFLKSLKHLLSESHHSPCLSHLNYHGYECWVFRAKLAAILIWFWATVHTTRQQSQRRNSTKSTIFYILLYKTTGHTDMCILPEHQKLYAILQILSDLLTYTWIPFDLVTTM